MPRTQPRATSLRVSGFQDGPIMLFIRSQSIIRSSHPNSIALVIIATSTVKQIVVSTLPHKPRPLHNPLLPALIIPQQQSRRPTNTQPIRRQLYRIDQCWLAMGIAIDLINQILNGVHSGKHCGVDYALGGVGKNGCSFVFVRAQDIIRLGDADAQFAVGGLSGRVVNCELAVDYVQLRSPVVAAFGPGGGSGHHPTDLGEVAACRAFPDWEEVAVPAAGRDGVVSAIEVDGAGVRGVVLALNGIDVAMGDGQEQGQKCSFHQIDFQQQKEYLFQKAEKYKRF